MNRVLEGKLEKDIKKRGRKFINDVKKRET